MGVSKVFDDPYPTMFYQLVSAICELFSVSHIVSISCASVGISYKPENRISVPFPQCCCEIAIAKNTPSILTKLSWLYVSSTSLFTHRYRYIRGTSRLPIVEPQNPRRSVTLGCLVATQSEIRGEHLLVKPTSSLQYTKQYMYCMS